MLQYASTLGAWVKAAGMGLPPMIHRKSSAALADEHAETRLHCDVTGAKPNSFSNVSAGKTEAQHREELALFGHMLHQRGLVVAADGNLSVRMEDGAILATPTSVCKGLMQPEDMVVVDDQGNRVKGRRLITSEIGMHLAIYRLRPDVMAVVHAHPPIATGFAAAGLAIDQPLVAESVVCLGTVPLAPFAMPGTPALAQSMEQFIPDHNAVLLANHGAVTYGETLQQAFWRMETLEHVAKITLVTRVLGQQNPLAEGDVRRLLGVI